MKKSVLILVFLCSACFLSAQCLKIQNCPGAVQSLCDSTNNDPALWNDTYWWNATYATHNLTDAPADFSLTLLDTCGAGNITVRYLLRLDLDGDGVRETAVRSDSLPGWNKIYYDNIKTGSLTGGSLRGFDTRPVGPDQQYGFALETTLNGNALTARVRWNTEKTPGTFTAPQLPYGVHQLVWTVAQNGAEYTCSYYIVVKDCQKPVVVCINGLSVNIMPTMMIVLWWSDFIQYATDNATPDQQIVFGIRRSGTGSGFPLNPDGTPQTYVQFTCNDLGTQLVELWAVDKAGNANYCETYLIVQDSANNCHQDPGAPLVCVRDACANMGMPDVSLDIQGSTSPALPPFPLFNLTYTGQDGCWNAGKSLAFLSDYEITPYRDSDPLNGVSTLDLIVINKHILGIEPLNTPYKIIAADANNSRSLTTFDIVELRKLILGVYAEFPNNTSWRFVAKSYVFPNPNNPFQAVFPESIKANTLSQDLEFVGVKVGDVNCTAIANSLAGPAEARATASLDLPALALQPGETAELPLRVTGAADWSGMQFGLQFDPGRVAIEAVLPGDLPGLDGEAYALPQPGLLTLSWFDAGPRHLPAGAVVLRVRVRALAPVQVPEAVEFTALRLNPEAYTADEQVQNLQLLFRDQGEAAPGQATVFQPQPNPTAGATDIPVQLAEAAPVRLELFDLQGRAVHAFEADLPAGLQRLTVPAAALSNPGVYVWRVQAGEVVRGGKLVKY